MTTAADLAASKRPTRNLYTECVNFWGASLSAPTSTNLRIMARKGLLTDEADAQRVLTMPITMKEMMDIFLKNEEGMLKEFADDKGIPFHFETVKVYQKQYPNPEHAEMVFFDDEKSEEEIVYGIIVNTATKSTFLIFRGSVSKRDYDADFDVKMREFKDDQDEMVRAQKGFSDYLFGTEEEQDKARSTGHGENFSKFHEIKKSLLEQFEKYPDHELSITGHSLGASLAVMMAAALAYQDDVKAVLRKVGPIRVVGFGALLVGDLRLLRSFQRLEKENFIRSTVIMNQGDLIPLLPFSSGCRFYRGCGKRVLISGGRRKPIVYSPPDPWPCNQKDWFSLPGFILPRFCFILCCRRRFWENHTVETTTRNILGSKKYLEDLTVEDLYEKNSCWPCTLR